MTPQINSNLPPWDGLAPAIGLPSAIFQPALAGPTPAGIRVNSIHGSIECAQAASELDDDVATRTHIAEARVGLVQVQDRFAGCPMGAISLEETAEDVTERVVMSPDYGSGATVCLGMMGERRRPQTLRTPRTYHAYIKAATQRREGAEAILGTRPCRAEEVGA